MSNSSNSPQRTRRMPWELRLAFALLLLVAAILILTWCITRVNHYLDHPQQHLYYAIATAAAAFAVVGTGINALIVAVEKIR